MSCSAEREKELAGQGWTRQFMATEPRLGEAARQYRELGFEVLLEPVDPAACQRQGQCAACFEHPEAAARLKVIFTRPRAAAGEKTAPDLATPVKLLT